MSGYFAALSAADVLVELAEQSAEVVLLTQDFGPIGAFTSRFPRPPLRRGDQRGEPGRGGGRPGARRHAPFVLAMAPFLSMRGFEQIRDDCAYNRNNVKFLAPFAGLEAGPWGRRTTPSRIWRCCAPSPA